MTTFDFLVLNDVIEEVLREEYLSGSGFSEFKALPPETKDGFYRDFGFFSRILKTSEQRFYEREKQINDAYNANQKGGQENG